MHSAVRPLVCRWMVVAATAAGDVGGFSRLPLLAMASRECCVHPSLSRMGSGGCRGTVRSLARQRPEPLSTHSFGHPRLLTPACRKREPRSFGEGLDAAACVVSDIFCAVRAARRV